MEFDVEVMILTEEEEAMLGKSPHELVLLLKEKQKETDMAKSSNESAKLEIEQMKNRLQIKRFGYTSFSTYGTLYISVQWSVACNLFIKLHHRKSQSGRKSCMLLDDEMFMFLCRVWSGFQEQDLADRFSCSLSSVSQLLPGPISF